MPDIGAPRGGIGAHGAPYDGVVAAGCAVRTIALLMAFLLIFHIRQLDSYMGYSALHAIF